MANAHEFFLAFEKSISLSPIEIELMLNRVSEVQEIIVSAFSDKKEIPSFRFDLHGSFRTNTMILRANNVCDLDFGIYLSEKPKQSFNILKTRFCQCLRGKINCLVENKDKHIRLLYSDKRNIDITIYYEGIGNANPRLARHSSWMPSNPKALYDWYLETTKENLQAIRLVKYFKYWASLNAIKTPSGVAISVWVGKNFGIDNRDDLCFNKVAYIILSKLRKEFLCLNPVSPHDSLTKSLQRRHKKKFISMLESLVNNSNKAIAEPQLNKSIEIWSHELGKKFYF